MLSRIRRELAEIKARGQLKSFARSDRTSPSEIEIRGKRLIDFTSWDYLGLGRDPKVKLAAQQSIEADGVSIASPRLLTGTRLSHLALEDRLALFLQMPSALLFASRNQAVFSLLTSTLSESDVIFCDDSTSAPIHDAAYLVGASSHTISFSSPNWIARIEEEALKVRGDGKILIFVESLSPVTGLIAPLPDIILTAAKTKGSIIIDETYSLGGLGMRGAGVLESGKATQGVFAVIGGFGFGLPGTGSFIAGSEDLIGLLVNRSRTLVVEPPLPTGMVSSTLAAIDSAEILIGHRDELIKKSELLRAAFVKGGFNLVSSQGAPCVMVEFDKPSVADEFIKALVEREILAERVPRGTLRQEQSLVRFVLNYTHTESQIEKLREAILTLASKISR